MYNMINNFHHYNNNNINNNTSMTLQSINVSIPSISKIYNSLSTKDTKHLLTFSSMNFNGDLLSLSPSINLTNNNIEEIKDIDENSKVNAYYLWSCGVWTNSTQTARYFDDNLLIKPKLAIIHPNNMDNINILSGISSPSSSDLIATSSIVSNDSKFDDNSSVKSGFSSRQGSVPPPLSSSSLSSSRRNKKLGSFKNYVFFSNRLTSTFEHKLGRNSRGLDHQTLYQFEARKFQFSLLRGDIRFIKNYNTNLEYLIFKFGRSNEYNQLYGICERNDRRPERQPWCCQHILTINEMIDFFGIRNYNKNIIEEFLLNIKINDSCVEKIFNPLMDYNPNLNKITRMLKHGFYDYNKGRDRRNNDHFSDDSSCSQYSNYSRRSGRSVRSNRGRKIKNEDKFAYLEEVSHQLNVGIKELLGLIGNAIVDAFEFARRHPETAMTQAYIDEEKGTINFELVLEAELYDNIYNKYYKFAVPIVKCQNKQTKAFYYEAKNILTPKMAIDNIRLNSSNAKLNNKSWIYDLNNWSSSFYRKYEQSWFENLNTLEYKKTNRNNKNYNNNTKTNKNYKNANNNNNRNKPNTYAPIGLKLNRNPSNDSDFSVNSNISNFSNVSNDRARKTPRSNLILSSHQYMRHDSANSQSSTTSFGSVFSSLNGNNNIRDEEDISVFSQSSPIKDYESDIETDDEDDSDCEYGPIKDFHSIPSSKMNNNNIGAMSGMLRRLSVEDMSPSLPQLSKMRTSEELINFE